MGAAVRTCVVSNLTTRGKGVVGSPVRVITEIWDSYTGEKIGEYDPIYKYEYASDSYIKVKE